MAGKHSSQHVSQHSAPRASSRTSRSERRYDEEEEYMPRSARETYSRDKYDPEYKEYEREQEYAPRRAPQSREADHRQAREYQPVRQQPKKKGSRGPGAFSLIIRDIFITGLILCVFAMFHHVIPRMSEKGETAMPLGVIQTPAPVHTPEAQPEPVQSGEQGSEPEEVAETEPEPEPEPDDRTEWQKKFADKFTDEVVVTENSYSSPDVSITLEKITNSDSPYGQTVYYLADVYVASLDCFKTYFANGKLTYYGYEAPLSAARNSGAIISINGDYADNQKEGFLVRNGELYYQEKSIFDICVLYYDGVMETYLPGEYEVEDILARSPVQSWKFGPALLDASGHAKTVFNETSSGIDGGNPRSAIGYYEPGHYCLMIADGRQSFSRGFSLEELSAVFESLGCKAAYNLDGGASAVMVFNGKIINSPSNGGRDCGDIVLVCEPAGAEEGAEG